MRYLWCLCLFPFTLHHPATLLLHPISPSHCSLQSHQVIPSDTVNRQSLSVSISFLCILNAANSLVFHLQPTYLPPNSSWVTALSGQATVFITSKTTDPVQSALATTRISNHLLCVTLSSNLKAVGDSYPPHSKYHYLYLLNISGHCHPFSVLTVTAFI